MKSVLIGTLYCGEGDFDRCRHSIKALAYPHKHFVVENLVETEAHYALYSHFKQGDYDYLLKVDADMVLIDPGCLEYLIELVTTHPHIHRVSHTVSDYFTGRDIWGINFYSQEVQWDFTSIRKKGLLRPDHHDSTYDAKWGNVVMQIPKPLAFHCHFASEKQSFHFGYHRFLKSQIKECRLVINRYMTQERQNLRFACLGIIMADKHQDLDCYCYGKPFDRLFEQSKKDSQLWSKAEILQKASKALEHAI